MGLGWAKRYSLHVRARELVKHGELLFGFNAFGDDVDGEVFGEGMTAATMAVSSRWYRSIG